MICKVEKTMYLFNHITIPEPMEGPMAKKMALVEFWVGEFLQKTMIPGPKTTFAIITEIKEQIEDRSMSDCEVKIRFE